jgi:hypothetical protein
MTAHEIWQAQIQHERFRATGLVCATVVHLLAYELRERERRVGHDGDATS